MEGKEHTPIGLLKAVDQKASKDSKDSESN